MKVNRCGTFVSKIYPFLAATPDATVDNFCIEVKCPFSARDDTISPETVKCLRYSPSKEMMLDNSHPYYYQIKGQLFCAEKRLCFLVIYTFKDCLILPIERDDDFIREMVRI